MKGVSLLDFSKLKLSHNPTTIGMHCVASVDGVYLAVLFIGKCHICTICLG